MLPSKRTAATYFDGIPLVSVVTELKCVIIWLSFL